MQEQGNSGQNIGLQVEPKEGERALLSCNTADIRSPSLEFDSSSPLVSEKMQLDYLAEILVDFVVEQMRKDEKHKKARSIILSSIDERTS